METAVPFGVAGGQGAPGAILGLRSAVYGGHLHGSGGVGPHPEDLLHMKRTADRLFGDDYVWSVLAAGRHQMRLVTMGAILGGNARVGLEDSIYLAKGVLAESKAQQVEKIARVLGELSLEIATPEEAREMLGLKGRDRTAIPSS